MCECVLASLSGGQPRSMQEDILQLLDHYFLFFPEFPVPASCPANVLARFVCLLVWKAASLMGSGQRSNSLFTATDGIGSSSVHAGVHAPMFILHLPAMITVTWEAFKMLVLFDHFDVCNCKWKHQIFRTSVPKNPFRGRQWTTHSMNLNWCETEAISIYRVKLLDFLCCISLKLFWVIPVRRICICVNFKRKNHLINVQQWQNILVKKCEFTDKMHCVFKVWINQCHNVKMSAWSKKWACILFHAQQGATSLVAKRWGTFIIRV